MAPDLDRDRPADDEPTERFAVQKCPHCAATTVVALCFATAGCAVCGERFEVAPLLAMTIRDEPQPTELSSFCCIISPSIPGRPMRHARPDERGGDATN